MPSRADEVTAPRVMAERGLRAAAFVLAAYALWRFARPMDGAGAVGIAGNALDRELPALVTRPVTAVDVTLEGAPSPAARDLLAALAHAGTRVTWRARPAIAPLAVAVTRLREPGGGVRVSVVSDGTVDLRDGLAPLDSVNASRGATLLADADANIISARAGVTRAAVVPPAPAPLHAVLVLGRVSWETKFVIAALEERGWRVDTRMVVAPGADVTQGTDGMPDTSRYAAVVALDTALGRAGPGIVRFVHDGGGLVLLAGAANALALRAIAPARAGARRAPVARAFEVARPRDALPLDPLEDLRDDAIRLAMQGPRVAMAARREGAGRVVQVGYDETWRWRMEGGEDAVAAHRSWWSGLVGSVAASGTPNGAAAGSAEGAPFARLVDALGVATMQPPAHTQPGDLPRWILPVILLLLIAEWASRRLRGAR